jgi:soluble calcium-activated nucleotidase 1
MEIYEIIVFNGKMYVIDERKGIVYELLDDKVIPFVILNEGNGRMNKGLK